MLHIKCGERPRITMASGCLTENAEPLQRVAISEEKQHEDDSSNCLLIIIHPGRFRQTLHAHLTPPVLGKLGTSTRLGRIRS